MIEPVQAGCLRALGMLASGRAWLVFFISLAVVVQAGLFALAYWGGVLEEPYEEIYAPAAEPAEPEGLDDAEVEPQQAAPLRSSEPRVQLLWTADRAAPVQVAQARPAPRGLPGEEDSERPPPVIGPVPPSEDAEPLEEGYGEELEEPAARGARDYIRDLLPRTTWERLMRVALPISGFVGLAASILLVIVTFFAVQVNLIGRLAALPAMISAFYWSIMTLAILFPWGRVVGRQLGERIPWAFFDFREVAAAVEAGRDSTDVEPLIWVRFLIWPVVGLLSAWMCGARFGKSYWQAVGLSEAEGRVRGEPPREA